MRFGGLFAVDVVSVLLSLPLTVSIHWDLMGGHTPVLSLLSAGCFIPPEGALFTLLW